MADRVPIIRTSERGQFGRCPWAWWQRWRRGLVPIGTGGTSDALWFGTLVHIALAEWYKYPGLKRGAHPAETFARLAEGELRQIKTERRIADHVIEEKYIPAQELGPVMLNGYVETYGTDDSWEVISAERSGQLDVLDPDDRATLIAIYAWTFDLVYRDLVTGRIMLGEHKTAKTISTGHLPLDNQAGSYWAIAQPYLRAEGILGPRESIAGITYNILRKALPDPRPRNADGYCTNKPVKADYVAALMEDLGYAALPEDARARAEKDLLKRKLEDLADFAGKRCLEVFGEISKQQPKPLFHRELVTRTAHERASQIRRIGEEAVVMDMIRHRQLPILKNSTRDCQWCDYFEYCLLDEKGADAEEFRRSMFRRADPYADHRKSTEE